MPMWRILEPVRIACSLRCHSIIRHADDGL